MVPGRQIVSNGAELTCYLPDQRKVLVEKAPQTLMPAGLPKFDAAARRRFYQLEDLGAIRQMGQNAQVISVTPRDGFRYGYRTVDPALERHAAEDGVAGHQRHGHRGKSYFPSVSLRRHIADEELKPQLVTTGYEWLRDDGAPAVTVVSPAAVWTNTPLRPDFHLAAQTAQMMPGAATPVTHLVFSDGIATVSVFIQTMTVRSGPDPLHGWYPCPRALRPLPLGAVGAQVHRPGRSTPCDRALHHRGSDASTDRPLAAAARRADHFRKTGTGARTQMSARLTVVHRQDCELCDQMVAELAALRRRETLPPIDVVDVDGDPDLQRRHGLNVPVLLLDGTVVCRAAAGYSRTSANGAPAIGRPARRAVTLYNAPRPQDSPRGGQSFFSCGLYVTSPLLPTSTTANPHWRTGLIQLCGGARRPRDAGAGPGLDGPGARTRHHHQGPKASRCCITPRTASVMSSTSSTRRDTWTSPTRCPDRWPPAMARCWWWTLPRAWRRKASPTATRRSSRAWKSCRSINKIDLPSADPDRGGQGNRGHHRYHRR